MSNDEGYPPETDIYEHGIEAKGENIQPSLRLIATAKLPIYFGFTLTIVDDKGRSLTERAVHLFRVDQAHAVADYYEEDDLRYCVLATLYHLNRLVDLYVKLTRLFERLHPVGTAVKGNTSDPSVFYEVDAFLGSARRVYESLRKVLWKHYRGRGTTGRWSSIRKVVNSPDGIPTSFAASLQQSWWSVGEKLTAYRDCVAHYDPLTDGATTCWMNWHGDRWGVTVKLPSNPDRHSRQAFDFRSGPEALSYCYSVACHLVELCELLEAQAAIRSHLDNPRR
jgi:hypothetical protein